MQNISLSEMQGVGIMVISEERLYQQHHRAACILCYPDFFDNTTRKW